MNILFGRSTPSFAALRRESARGASRSTWILAALLVVAAGVMAPSARADAYDFSFSGGGLSGSGVLTYSNTAVPGVAGGYQITGISGTFSDVANGISDAMITGIQATGLPTDFTGTTFVPPGSQADGYGFSYDNLFFPAGDSPAVCPPGPDQYPFGGGVFDIYGLLFNVQGGYTVDIWSNGVIPGPTGLTYGAGDAQNGDVLTADAAVDLNVAPAPEPGSLVLLGTGLLAGMGELRRRSAKLMKTA